ncbi:uroporphyrinogen-III C-methyltransferase [Methylotenera mobilis]|jgi:uroporphyrin-3 C-methyltransferase|uniref:Heme biosynthesis operon protein HemX n=1 Tax=Methylotenera mobilis TaxID=359408 RepID=A0A351R8U9_9PROT|nr:uroporphyrinogen-III C-methyltransferase [Methylotenera mobilis]PPC97238.1 MAG: heme biosynthesis operon protein HemX [Methylotenera sp.]HBA08470.1 heme biosynthesis operon protein HemX [Methylotenera mobilis]
MTNSTDSEFVARQKPSMLTIGTMVLVVIAILTLAWQWLNTRHRFNEIEKSLSFKLEEYHTLNQQSLALAKQAEERSTQANARTVILEQKLAESRDQQEALQTLYTQLAENREATAVAEVEQLLTIAKQQLQLASNVKSALLALEAADHRLQPLDLPRAVQLREILQVEIETLRDLPQIDMIAMSTQLTYLAELCNTIPLISERQPTLNVNANLNPAPVQSLQGVQKFWWAIWDDIKNLVTVERIDKPEPPLLAAEHALYLRENLKLRLLTARIALLQHDESTYKADLNMVNTWLNQYFDTKHPDTIKALVLLKKLSSNNISLELPQLSDSLAAVSSYKLMLEKSE